MSWSAVGISIAAHSIISNPMYNVKHCIRGQAITFGGHFGSCVEAVKSFENLRKGHEGFEKAVNMKTALRNLRKGL